MVLEPKVLHNFNYKRRIIEFEFVLHFPNYCMQRFTLPDELVNRFRQCFPTGFLYLLWLPIAIQFLLYYAPPTALTGLGSPKQKPGFQLQRKSKSKLQRILLRDVFNLRGE